MDQFLWMAVVAGVVALIALIWWFTTLGRLLGLRAQVGEAVGSLVAQLRQRYDLIPDSLMAAREGVRSEMDYLKGILQTRAELAHTPSRAIDPDTPIELRPVLEAMSSGGGRSIHESNPTSSAPTALYQQLMKIMTSTEKDVTASRRFVQAAIGEYNAGIKGFPACIVAAIHGLTSLKNAKMTKKWATKPNYFA